MKRTTIREKAIAAARSILDDPRVEYYEVEITDAILRIVARCLPTKPSAIPKTPTPPFFCGHKLALRDVRAAIRGKK